MEYYNISGISSTEMESLEGNLKDTSIMKQEIPNHPKLTDLESETLVKIENGPNIEHPAQDQDTDRLNVAKLQYLNSENDTNGINNKMFGKLHNNNEDESQTQREDHWISIDRDRVETIKRQDEEIKELRKNLTELEKRCEAVEKKVKQIVVREEERMQFRTSESESSLETRIAALEATLGKAVNYMFPRMDEVLSRLEEVTGENFGSITTTYPAPSTHALSSSSSTFASVTKNTTSPQIPKEKDKINSHNTNANNSNTHVSLSSSTSVPSNTVASLLAPYSGPNIIFNSDIKENTPDIATQSSSSQISQSSSKSSSASILLDPKLLDDAKQNVDKIYSSSPNPNQKLSSSPTVSLEFSSNVDVSNLKAEHRKESEGESDLEMFSSGDPEAPSLIPPLSPLSALSTPPPPPPPRPLPDDLDTALRDAAKEGNADEVCRLLLSGAEADGRDNLRTTALHWAAIKGHVQVASALLEADATVDSRDVSGWTPLHFAASRGHASVVSFLVRRGASVSTADDKQWTPLHVAVHGGHAECVRLLLAAGADAFASDLMGRKILDLTDSQTVRKLLLKYLK